jgi:hypothetical protein
MHGICANNNPSRTERLKKVVPAGSHAWRGFMPACDSRTGPPASSARGQLPVQRLRAAHGLRRVSADIHSDSSLHLKSQTTNCED